MHVIAFLKFGVFFMSGTMSDKFGSLVLLWSIVLLYYSCLYKYEMETSFTNISGSNGPIILKFAQLFQQVI